MDAAQSHAPPFTVTTEPDGNTKVAIRGGKTYSLRPIGFDTVLAVAEAAGDQSGNVVFSQQATILLTVAAIDGVPMAAPASKAELYDVAKRIPLADIALLKMAAFGGLGGAPDAVAEDTAAKN